MTCFNKSPDGKCLAFTGGVCSFDCSARVPTIEGKIKLIESIMKYSQSYTDRVELRLELAHAQRIKTLLDEDKFEGWMSCYYQDMKRGEPGGASEGDANRSTGMKQLMKDNRPVGIKPTKSQLDEANKALEAFEEEHGKLERLGRTSMSSSKIDSYTGVAYCFVDDGDGTCKGVRSASDKLSKDCKECHLRKGSIN